MPDQEPTDKQQSEIDHKVDTRGIAYSDARQEVMGGKSSSPSPQDVGAPKRPRQHPKPGHVQDFDGRGDKDRGGPQLGEWLSPEQIETNRIGAEAARRALDEAASRDTEPTEEELRAARDAEVAEIKRKANEPWT